MNTASIYLNFNGNCEVAFNFYKSIFGGEFSYFSRFGEVPDSYEYKATDAYNNRIMHVALPMGNSVLMGSDCHEDQAESFVLGNNFSVSITADSKEDVDRLFKGLSEGGVVTMPINSTFWGDYFGMLTDKFGVNWMISFPEQQQQ
jgi:PhnB protein